MHHTIQHCPCHHAIQHDHATIHPEPHRYRPTTPRSTPHHPTGGHMAETANSAVYVFQEIRPATSAQQSDLRVSKSIFRVQF
jgi:hypothetical protein